jgi:hypothetical protein
MKRQYADVEIFPIDVLRILPACDDFDAGVYFLWKDDELQYIGKSRQICYRLQLQEQANAYGKWRTHHMKTIPFDRHTCIVVESGRIIGDIHALERKLQRLERAYIAHFQPPFNYLGQNPGT